MDETSYKKGHKYLTVVVGHERNRVVWACKGHGKARLDAFFDLLADGQRDAVELGVSNARAESANNKIKLAISMGYGFRNIDSLIALIMLRCSDPSRNCQAGWQHKVDATYPHILAKPHLSFISGLILSTYRMRFPLWIFLQRESIISSFFSPSNLCFRYNFLGKVE